MVFKQGLFLELNLINVILIEKLISIMELLSSMSFLAVYQNKSHHATCLSFRIFCFSFFLLAKLLAHFCAAQIVIAQFSVLGEFNAIATNWQTDSAHKMRKKYETHTKCA